MVPLAGRAVDPATDLPAVFARADVPDGAAALPSQLAPGTRIHVLTVSDGVAAGTREDASGAALERRLTAMGGRVDRAVVPDDVRLIRAAIVGRRREP